MSDLTDAQAALLLSLSDAYEKRNAQGNRDEFIFVTAGGGAGTTYLHPGASDGEAPLDLETLKELNDFQLVDAQFKQAKQGSFRLTAQGTQLARGLRQARDSVVAAEGDRSLGLEWQTEVLPVLEAVIRLFPPASAQPGISQESINSELSRDADDPRTGLVLRKLEEAGYVSGSIRVDQVEGPLYCEPAPKALELLGGWPAQRADAALGQLIAALERQIDGSTDETEKGKLQRLLSSMRDVGQGVMIAVLSDAIKRGDLPG